jgi:hypothetical protein
MKRPGVEPFLLEMGKRYEVVVYTDEPAMYADPVINKIDPHRAVLYRLYRQETQVRRRRRASESLCVCVDEDRQGRRGRPSCRSVFVRG